MRVGDLSAPYLLRQHGNSQGPKKSVRLILKDPTDLVVIWRWLMTRCAYVCTCVCGGGGGQETETQREREISNA